jgi:hypothetical protein
MRTFRSWVTLFLLAWLPLQAAAVPLLAACCADGRDAAMAAAHCHEQAAVADADEAPAHDGGDHGGNPGHLCCPHFSAAALHRFALEAAPVVLDAPTPLVADRSHIPEQPQRPPRA